MCGHGAACGAETGEVAGGKRARGATRWLGSRMPGAGRRRQRRASIWFRSRHRVHHGAVGRQVPQAGLHRRRDRLLQCRRSSGPLSLAARFAAKEAFYKAVSPWRGEPIGHKSIEVVVGEDGVPAIRPHGNARRALGDRAASLSLSHEQDLAVAVVVTSPCCRQSPAVLEREPRQRTAERGPRRGPQRETGGDRPRDASHRRGRPSATTCRASS